MDARARTVAAGLLALGLGLAGAACGSSTSSSARSTGAVMGRVGPLEVLDAYLPDPPSPSVAAVYLTIRNTGARPDRLVSLSSPSATNMMLMTEDSDGMDGSMAPLPAVAVPAHGDVALTPGHDHAMLEDPKVTFAVGRTVPVTLRFATAGTVTVSVPVVPFDRTISGGGGMAGMPGM